MSEKNKKFKLRKGNKSKCQYDFYVFDELNNTAAFINVSSKELNKPLLQKHLEAYVAELNSQGPDDEKNN